MRIQNKMLLRGKLNHNDYNVIAIFGDGQWAEVGTSYGGEKSGEKPIVILHRANLRDLTHSAITNLFRNIERDHTED